jgi:hypothetical protein
MNSTEEATSHLRRRDPVADEDDACLGEGTSAMFDASVTIRGADRGDSGQGFA